MDYDREPDTDETAHDRRQYETDAGQIQECFQRYRQTGDLEELVGMPVGNDQLNTLPLVIDQDSDAWEDLGDFLTTVYNTVGWANDDETVFSYETETQRPLLDLGSDLDRAVTVLTDGTLEDVGKQSYGEIINTGTIHGDLFAFGYRNRGRILNTGTIDGDMGRKQHGIAMNDGTVEQRLGRDSTGILYNAGEVHEAGPMDDGLFYNTGTIDAVSVTGDGGIYINTGSIGSINGLDEDTVIIDLDDGIDSDHSQIITDPAPLLERYVGSLTETLETDDIEERYETLESLDPMYGTPQKRPEQFIRDRLYDEDFLVQWTDYLGRLEPDPAPAIRATIEAIQAERLATIDLDAGATIHETVRLETEETDEPIDMRSYLGWQHAEAVESDERYVASDAISALLDEVM